MVIIRNPKIVLVIIQAPILDGEVGVRVCKFWTSRFSSWGLRVLG